MNPGTLKAIGVACLLICAGAVFVAVQSYQDAKTVVGIDGVFTVRVEEPEMPAATKYAIMVAVLSFIGGGISLVSAYRRPRRGS